MNDKSTPTSKQIGDRRYSGAEIHRGLSVDNHKHLRELDYVLASDYEALRQRFAKACGEVTRLTSALASIGEYDCPGGVHAKNCPGCAACDANEALSQSSAHETTEPKPVAWRWIVDSPFEPRIRWGFSESKVEGVNAEPLYLRPSPEEPEPPHTGIVHAGGPHTIHEGSRADCVICSPRKPAWDCACNKPDCAYCGPRLTENGSDRT